MYADELGMLSIRWKENGIGTEYAGTARGA